MLVIRFFRIGKKNQPSFKIVVTDKRNPPGGGRFIEEVGFYNPLTKEKFLRRERFQYWLSKGAQPSPTVHNLLVEEKIIQDKKIPVHPVRKLKREGEGEPIAKETPKGEKEEKEEREEREEREEKEKKEEKEEKEGVRKEEKTVKEEIASDRKEEPKKEETEEESKEEAKKEK